MFQRWLWKVPLIVLLVSFALWWQWRKDQEGKLPREFARAVAKSADAFAGHWVAEVAYPWGVKSTEQFFFQPEGARLFGTASFLGVKRGIEAGEMIGDKVSFKVRFGGVNGAATQLRWNRYEGTLVGAKIRLKLYDDKGNAPLEIQLIRRPADGDSRPANQ